jgi:uncharacterized protein (DUF58 family)
MSGEPFNDLISLSGIAELELVILKRLKERTLGDHSSIAKGSGHDFVGIREWEPSDRVSAIDWAQSSLTNFSPLLAREFEQPSKATILAVADASLSTRCGSARLVIAHAIARCIATFGLSATLFQDPFGLVLFDHNQVVATVRPRIGRPHLLHCLEVYCHGSAAAPRAGAPRLAESIAAHLREPALLIVMSDFLSADAPEILRDLARLNGVHDVFLVMPDARPAFKIPAVHDGWVRVADVESGETQVMSRRECRQLVDRVEQWQVGLLHQARDLDLDIVRVDLEAGQLELALSSFVAERRWRKLR